MKKKTKKIKSLSIVKKEKSNLVFAGAQRLMSKPKDPKEKAERGIIVMVAEAIGISPFGVNILGNLPYTNNIGRKEKMEQYAKGAQFEYRWVKRSEDDTDKAICECRVLVANKPLCGWVVGECSPKTIKMGPLQGYQNHMAQTRAENRAFEAAFGNKFRLELFHNVQTMLSKGHVDVTDASRALNAGGQSAEEMTMVSKQKSDATGDDVFDMAQQAIRGAKTTTSLMAILERVNESKKLSKVQKAELEKLISGMMDRLDS